MKTYELEYQHENITCKGYVAEPENRSENTPVVMFVHMWSGRVSFVDEKAKLATQKVILALPLICMGTVKLVTQSKKTQL